MKNCFKISLLFPLAIVVLFFPRAAYSADNFGRDLTKTQLPSNYQIRQQPKHQTSSVLPTPAPQNQAAINMPSLQQTQKIDASSQLPAQTPQASQISMLQKFTKPKITVPDYEEKYQKIIRAMQEKAARKKRKLSETLLEEIDKYGIFINIALIILIMVYVVYKERLKESSSDIPPDDEDKSIWREQF
ncbi:MAG: hypothetical protein ABIC68_00410 [Candidatus Omnitrophota bacterium]